jgi:hypothetical protein
MFLFLLVINHQAPLNSLELSLILKDAMGYYTLDYGLKESLQTIINLN